MGLILYLDFSFKGRRWYGTILWTVLVFFLGGGDDFIRLSNFEAACMIWFRLLLACCLGLNASQADPACSSIVRKTFPHHIQRLGSFCLRHLGDTRSQGMLRLATPDERVASCI